VFVTLASAALAALAFLQQIDTTVTAQQGQRLVVDSYGGEIAVKTWGRNAVRVEADPPARAEVQVSSSSAAVSVRSEGRRGPPASIDYTITVPTWMGLDLTGVYSDVKVEGVRGPITVQTVQGEVDVAGGEGTVSLRSVQGAVKLRGARGRIDVHSVNDEVRVSESSGEITAETVNGDVALERVDATSLNATTVNGDLGYDGPIRNGGRYILSTHNGDITLAASESTSATIMVSTFSGDFESDFAVPLKETRKGRRFSFTLGGGSAQVSLESFQGTIHLVRPGHGNRDDGDDRHDRDDDDSSR
jgi:DUF4097 and DUF4098 domain-containing protein YvlB